MRSHRVCMYLILALCAIVLDALRTDQSGNFGALETKLYLAQIIEHFAACGVFMFGESKE